MSDYLQLLKYPIALGVGLACRRYLTNSQVFTVVPSAIIIYETRSLEATRGLVFLYAPYYLFKLGDTITRRVGERRWLPSADTINNACAGLSLYCIYQSSVIFSKIASKVNVSDFWGWTMQQAFGVMAFTQMSYFLVTLAGFGTVYIVTEYAKRRLGNPYDLISRYMQEISDRINEMTTMHSDISAPDAPLTLDELEAVAPLRCKGISSSDPTEVFSTPDDCSICLQEFNVSQLHRMLRCRHSFHTDCVDRWLSSHRVCPICRSSIYGDEDVEN
jgi:hypothetical protein